MALCVMCSESGLTWVNDPMVSSSPVLKKGSKLHKCKFDREPQYHTKPLPKNKSNKRGKPARELGTIDHAERLRNEYVASSIYVDECPELNDIYDAHFDDFHCEPPDLELMTKVVAKISALILSKPAIAVKLNQQAQRNIQLVQYSKHANKKKGKRKRRHWMA